MASNFALAFLLNVMVSMIFPLLTVGLYPAHNINWDKITCGSEAEGNRVLACCQLFCRLL